MPGARRLSAVLIAALALGAFEVGATPTTPGDVRAADGLAGQPPSRERDRLLERWAVRAPLVELLYVLRRPPVELGRSEAALVRAAVARAPKDRVALRRNLASRLALVAPGAGRRTLAELGSTPVSRPRASVFRIAALLPDSGNYEAEGRAVRLGIEVGLEHANARTSTPIELAFWPTGDDQPARAAAAFDSAAVLSGVVIGELLVPPTQALTTESRRL
ncbi:MAG TPA: hypothetical protein VEY91_12245, partial [Candidatus Limnocylindria bacterium]|nr:hypothetical protein [Candidatus Limnocylindria bacterium]